MKSHRDLRAASEPVVLPLSHVEKRGVFVHALQIETYILRPIDDPLEFGALAVEVSASWRAFKRCEPFALGITKLIHRGSIVSGHRRKESGEELVSQYRLARVPLCSRIGRY